MSLQDLHTMNFQFGLLAALKLEEAKYIPVINSLHQQRFKPVALAFNELQNSEAPLTGLPQRLVASPVTGEYQIVNDMIASGVTYEWLKGNAFRPTAYQFNLSEAEAGIHLFSSSLGIREKTALHRFARLFMNVNAAVS